MPGTVATGRQRVRLQAGTTVLERSLTDRQSVEGGHLALSAPFPAMAPNVWKEATYTLTNLAAHPLGNIGFELEPSTVFVLDRHTCAAGLAAAGQAGSACTVTNIGLGPVVLGAVQAPAAPFRLESGSCAPGLVLEQGASCTLVTRFTASATSPAVTEGRMTMAAGKTTASFTLKGTTTPTGDVSVTLRAPAGTALFEGQVVFEALVTNRGTSAARVRVALSSTASDPAALKGLSTIAWRADAGVSAVAGEPSVYVLPAGQRWFGYVTVNVASVPGTVTVRGSAELLDQVDRNPGDNSASASTLIVAK